MNDIDKMAKRIHDCAKEKGWWDRKREWPEIIALMHSELSEALEHYRAGNDDVFYEEDKEGNEKPDGLPVEIADCIIRCLDALMEFGYSPSMLLELKVKYNESRPYKHGGKVI